MEENTMEGMEAIEDSFILNQPIELQPEAVETLQQEGSSPYPIPIEMILRPVELQIYKEFIEKAAKLKIGIVRFQAELSENQVRFFGVAFVDQASIPNALNIRLDDQTQALLLMSVFKVFDTPLKEITGQWNWSLMKDTLVKVDRNISEPVAPASTNYDEDEDDEDEEDDY